MASVLSISVSSLRLDEATDFSASSGHSENQSIVQQVTRLGNCLSLDLKTSPIGLNEIITVTFYHAALLYKHMQHTHTQTHTYIHTYTPVHPYTHVHKHTYIHKHNTHTHRHTYIHSCRNIHINIYIYVRIIRTYYTYTFIPHIDNKMYIGAYSLSINRKQVSLSRLLTSINHNWLHHIVDVIKILKLKNVWYITRVQYIINILQE